VKSRYRKLALFVRVGGEGEVHTCVKGCYRSLIFFGWVFAVKRALSAFVFFASVLLVTPSDGQAIGSVWRSRLDLKQVDSDPVKLANLLIIYRPSYRQTLFVFGTGKVVLQTYPETLFSQSAAPIPTCRSTIGVDEVKQLALTLNARLFDLPEKSYVDTGEYASVTTFLKELRDHSIIVDDGASRAFRDFAEGTYRGKQEEIPREFSEIERPLQQLLTRTSAVSNCRLAHYMEWRRTGRGEILSRNER
jgi:hypothetical protein